MELDRDLGKCTRELWGIGNKGFGSGSMESGADSGTESGGENLGFHNEALDFGVYSSGGC